jgi:hypothetical protein
MNEKCKNPWKPNCEETDIKLYIQIKGEDLPICKTCWDKIAASNHEWGTPTKTNDTAGNLIAE